MHLCMLLNFTTLVVTGVLRFTLPFSLAVTRLHIISGFIVTLLIGIHIFQRLKILKNIAVPRGKRRASDFLPLVYSIVFSGVVWAAAWWAWPGAKEIVDLSYEARHQKSIFRERPNVVGNVTESKVHAFKLVSEYAAIDVQLDWQKPSKDFAVAIWAETNAYQIIETLHLSEPLKFKEDAEWEGKILNRGQILPLWRNRYTQISGIGPEGQADLQSGPTENHEFGLEEKIENKESFTIYIEINAPDDNQPSVLYAALIDPESPNPYTLLSLVGTGEGSYESGEINYDQSTLSSAKHLVEKILVKAIWKQQGKEGN